MNNESKSSFPVELTALPAINHIIWDAEEKLEKICGSKVKVLIKMPSRDEISVLSIQQQVCDEFNVSWKDIAGNRRFRPTIYARFAYCWLCRKYLKMSLQAIGDTLGGRDHTSVMHGLRVVKDLLDTKDIVMAPMLRIIESTLTYARTA